MHRRASGTVQGSLTVAIAAVLALGACGESDMPRPEADDPSKPSIAALLEDIVPERATGTAIAAKDGEIVHCSGFGSAAGSKDAPGCDTVYDISSITKQFTAAAILKLEMMGKLRLRHRLARFVGPVPSDKRLITVHQLLTHTAGLTGALGDDYDPLSRQEMVSQALASDLRSRPGTEHHYSNLGYSLLAAIVEQASGMGYEEFLAEQLLEPAGMTQTGYVLPNWDPERVATEYDPRGRPQGRPFDHPWASDGPYWNLRGNGGLLSTARDMFRWHLALEGDELLDAGAKRRLFRPYVPEVEGTDSYYGYGWTIVSLPGYGKVATHNGGNGWSFGRYARLLDQGVMVFWVSNHARRTGAWNLEELDRRLTLGIARLA